MTRTKIVATIGPASRDPETLARLMEAGVNVCRLNFSHGTHQEHAAVMADIRRVAAEGGYTVAILQDLAGPKIRTGPMADGTAVLVSGAEIVLTTRDVPGSAEEVGLTWKGLPAGLEPGDTVLLADGAMELEVVNADDVDARCRVVNGGELGSNKGINLPSRSINAPVLGRKDRDDLLFGLEQGVDWVALSFVRDAADVAGAKKLIADQGCDTPLMAKIEKFEALENIDAILEQADGLMVARGDLGVEIPLEQVPRAQKMLIAKANAAAKPVVTATQMLKSMVDSPRPTRAEVTDVANAIFDGTDAVMLSEETAMGEYPVEAVTVMRKVAADTESQLDEQPTRTCEQGSGKLSFEAAVAHNAVQMAHDIRARAIITCTTSGSTTRMVARYRPRQPLLAVTPHEITARRVAMISGAVPLLVEAMDSAEDLERGAVAAALAAGWVDAGDPVVITAGLPFHVAGTTNLIKVARA
ncbi:MAG: pyruvate kinase [bacterium]|nr:pyruvate kinase [bacterium]